jgi:hypothetical protein
MMCSIVCRAIKYHCRGETKIKPYFKSNKFNSIQTNDAILTTDYKFVFINTNIFLSIINSSFIFSDYFNILVENFCLVKKMKPNKP